MVKNAYIHIPFCKSKCKYCSFISYAQIDKKDEYIKHLLEEIQYFYRREKLNTLYIGGGTPSLLNSGDISKLVSQFNFEDDAELTIELNPENLDKDYFSKLKDSGINRISMGCQTFDDHILKLIGRRHSSFHVEAAVKLAQGCGFENISLDFIYGLPEQCTASFADDLNRAVSLGVKHISLYGLKIDEGCYFYNNMPENLADDDTQADMYLKAIELLKNNGFEHYEVSNFAKRNYYSRHNLNYWDNNSYYGFGISAHGYVNGVRYSNYCDFESYFKNPITHAREHELSEQEILEEEIFLGFRKMSGINLNDINKKFGINFEEKYSEILKKYLSYGYLSKTENVYKLTDSGILLSNTILSDFLE